MAMTAAQLQTLLGALKPSIGQIISGIRRYDGSTPAEEWLLSYNNDCQDNGLEDRWKILNVDRFFSGSPANWWCSRRSHYNRLVLAEDAKAQKDISVIWNAL